MHTRPLSLGHCATFGRSSGLLTSMGLNHCYAICADGDSCTERQSRLTEHVHSNIHCNAWTRICTRVGGQGYKYRYWGDWSDRAKLQTHSTLLSSAVEDSNKDEATRARSDRAHTFTLAKCNARETLEWILSRVGQGKTGYPCLSYHKDL